MITHYSMGNLMALAMWEDGGFDYRCLFRDGLIDEGEYSIMDLAQLGRTCRLALAWCKLQLRAADAFDIERLARNLPATTLYTTLHGKPLPSHDTTNLVCPWEVSVATKF